MSAKRTGEFAEQTYQAAERFKANALLTDGSLFTPGVPIWTPELLGELHTRFLDRPDVAGDGGFWGKLQRQLDNSPPEVYQLMGEALYAHYLILDMRIETKRRNIIGRPRDHGDVIEWSPEPLAIPPELDAGLSSRFIRPGNNLRQLPFQVGTLLETVAAWKERDDHEQLLNNPWQFKEFMLAVNFRSQLLGTNQNRGDVERHLMLHILFPDYFESSLGGDKRSIANAGNFTRFVTQPTDDVDRKIWQIRQGLEAEIGVQGFSFYGPPVVERWRGDQPPPPPPPPPSGLKSLAGRLYLDDVSFLEKINDLLAEKKQVIFQGPPGTGKTFVARELARFLAGGDANADNRVTLVQFHPSYAYEDFVQGYRPTPAAEGQVGFTLRNGPLLRAAERAEQEPEARHYLIIDEINRGNLAAVFGELYFLLEYRGEKMKLQYSAEDSDEGFSLPKNLFIIGTMNTADRSIALVDLALRRRFYFVEFRPDEEPVKNVLGNWLSEKAPELGWVAAVVDLANRQLKDSDAANAALGPSYFMQDGLTADKVALIWRHSILPYLEERLYGDPDVRTKYALDLLRRQVSGQSGEDNAAEPTGAAGNESGSGGE